MPFFAEDFVMTYRNKGFTLIELLAVIAILAVLLAVVTPWVGDYVTTAQKLSDRRTLSVLNEALDRYKTEGGSLSALTEGTPMGHVLLHLQTPVVWAGFTHSFLRAAQTYRAQSLAATGSGSSYRLTQYGTYTQEEGTTPVAPLFSWSDDTRINKLSDWDALVYNGNGVGTSSVAFTTENSGAYRLTGADNGSARIEKTFGAISSGTINVSLKDIRALESTRETALVYLIKSGGDYEGVSLSGTGYSSKISWCSLYEYSLSSNTLLGTSLYQIGTDAFTSQKTFNVTIDFSPSRITCTVSEGGNDYSYTFTRSDSNSIVGIGIEAFQVQADVLSASVQEN